MATIITRELGPTAKGSPLTNSELDTNFINLNVAVTSFSGGYTFSATAPVDPKVGDRWLDSETGIEYTYFNDGTSSQWVEIKAAVSVSSNPANTTSTNVYSAQYNLSGVTTNGTETEIFVNGITNTRVPVPLNKTIYYTADITARRTDSSTDRAAFYLKSTGENMANIVSDIGLVYEVIVNKTDPAFSVDIRADNTNKSINVYVKGAAGKTISWLCALTVLEV